MLQKISYIIFIAIGIILFLSLFSHLYLSAQRRANRKERERAYQQTDFSPADIKQDIDYFQDLMERVHPYPMPTHPLGDIADKMQVLQRSINEPLTRVAFYREFAPVVSLLYDDHVVVYPLEPELTNRYEEGRKFFPFEVQFVEEHLYVRRNLSDETAIRAGMEILAINHMPVEELRTILISYYSGTRDAQKQVYLQDHFHEALFLVYGFGEQFELMLRDPTTNATSGSTVMGKARSQPKREAFCYEVIAPDTILFTYNAFADEDSTFRAFLTEMFTTTQEQNIRTLIIDIRQNQGGNSDYGDEIFRFLTAEPFIQASRSDFVISPERKTSFIRFVPSFMRWIPFQYMHPLLRPFWHGEEGGIVSRSFEPITPGENPLRFTGDIYLLIGPGTMSSASLFAATMKRYNMGILVGEETGGYATQYGEVIDVYLPNTGLRLWMPTSTIYGNGTGSIVPDHIITQTIDDVARHRDTVLEFIQNLSLRDIFLEDLPALSGTEQNPKE